MTSEVAAPDREERPGGRWSVPRLVDELLRLATLERAVAHVVAGWTPKVPELDDKLSFSEGFEDSMGRAAAFRHHALRLLERDEDALRVNPAWVEPLRQLDAGDDSAEVLAAFARDVRPFLHRRYHDLADRLDPLYDARTLVTVRAGIESLSSEAPSGGEPGPLTAALEAAWADEAGPRVHLDDVLWEPQDRVARPARPAARRRPSAGAMGFLRAGTRRDPRNIAGELNENVIAELCALELMCRCSYEHPDLPWDMHMAMARHAQDETRHAHMFRRLLAQRGVDEATLTQHASNYEYVYEFDECEPGSKRELVWRLLLMCTVLEALAIDKIPPEIATLDWLDQPDIARALDYISTEELFHAENGLRLTRQLCDEHGFDPMLERELVHGAFFGRQRDTRLAYLAADPERAALEIAILDGPDPDGIPFTSRTEVELRKRASFTDEECEQVDRWGYNPQSSYDAEDDEVMLSTSGPA